MSSRTQDYATKYLELVLENQAIPLIGDASGLQPSGADGDLYLALHTSAPSGTDQTSNEAAYTSYARQALSRTQADGDWTIAAGAATNANDVTFPEATGGSETNTHWSIGTAVSGTGYILWSGALSASIPVTTGVTPEVPAGELDITAT